MSSITVANEVANNVANNVAKIVSFDIGLRTCSVAIEEYDLAAALAVTHPPVAYEKNGEATAEMKVAVNQIGLCGKVIKLEKRDLGDKKTFFAGYAYRNLYDWATSLDEHLANATTILIEQQMKVNNIAQALMYHLQAFLMIKYPSLTVTLYPSKNKTRILGAPLKVANEEGKVKKVTKYQRKKWSTEQADQLLQARKDEAWHDYIFKHNKSKKDDLSDVLMQALSFVVDKCKPIKVTKSNKSIYST